MPDVSFKVELAIDKNNLDVCAMHQPELYAQWACNWADAVNDRDRSKDRLSLVRSECDTEIRSTPSEFGWTKVDKPPTEAFIASAICGHPNFVEANEDFLSACHEVNILSVAKESFEQRRKMIEVLVQLYVSSYYSGNKDFDRAYEPAVTKLAAEAHSEHLEQNPRLARRKLKTDDSSNS
jgi:hypothetical protein